MNKFVILVSGLLVFSAACFAASLSESGLKIGTYICNYYYKGDNKCKVVVYKDSVSSPNCDFAPIQVLESSIRKGKCSYQEPRKITYCYKCKYPEHSANCGVTLDQDENLFFSRCRTVAKNGRGIPVTGAIRNRAYQDSKNGKCEVISCDSDFLYE